MKTIVIKICACVIFKVKWYGSLKFGHPGYLIPLEASVQAGPGTTDLKKRFRNLLQIIKACPECHPADNNFNLFNGCQRGFYAFGCMGAVIYVHSFLPSAYCGFTDPGFFCQRGKGEMGIVLNICPLGRGCRGIFMKAYFHGYPSLFL